MSELSDNRVKKIIRAYPFVQFRDDEYVVAFFESYNEMAEEYLHSLNKLSLPCWTSPSITGALLDWVAMGIYGQVRPAVQLVRFQAARGPYDTVVYNETSYAHIQNYKAGEYSHMSDDIFKRVLTWNFYKNDGFNFSLDWLKRRIARFIHGVNGIDPQLQHTFDVSIQVSKGRYTLNIPDYRDGIADSLKAAIQQGFVKLPFIYDYDINLVVMR